MKYFEVYTHGTGSSCKGNEYKNEVDHYVLNGQTLCGLIVKNTWDWWRSRFHVASCKKCIKKASKQQ